MKKKKILVISAHPDDETLGCGGYILKYKKKFDFYSAFFCNGVSSRKIQNSQINNLIKRRKNAFVKASKMLGIKKFYDFDYPDNQLDKVPLLEIVNNITSGLLRKIRSFCPPLGSLDFSPLILIISLQIFLMLIVMPFRDFGISAIK